MEIYKIITSFISERHLLAKLSYELAVYLMAFRVATVITIRKVDIYHFPSALTCKSHILSILLSAKKSISSVFYWLSVQLNLTVLGSKWFGFLGLFFTKLVFSWPYLLVTSKLSHLIQSLRTFFFDTCLIF